MQAGTASRLIAPALGAIRQYWRPILLIQTASFLVVVLYYNWPAFASLAGQVGEFKRNGGLILPAVANIVASMFLPQIAVALTGTKRVLTVKDVMFQLGFFGFMGDIIDLLYRGLAMWLGPSVSVAIVAEKVLIDTLLFCPLVSIPFSALMFIWRDHGFRFRETGAAIRQGEFRNRYYPLLVTCWCFWLPTLIAVYSMPENLQFCLFLLAQASWSLILVYIATTDDLQ